MDITLVTLPAAELSRIRPLWEKLNVQHLQNSKSFKVHYQNQIFEVRCAKFRMLPQDSVYIGAALTPDGTLVGYCICTCEGEEGEMDSIFIIPDNIKQGSCCVGKEPCLFLCAVRGQPSEGVGVYSKLIAVPSEVLPVMV